MRKKKSDDKPVIKRYMRDGTTKVLSTGSYADRVRHGKTKRKRMKVAA